MMDDLMVFLLCFCMHLNFSIGQVQVVYLDQQPKTLENQTYCKIEADNYLDRVEVLLELAEKKLIELAEKNNSKKVEIFIFEKENGDIPTESHAGKKSYISFFFLLK